uniref:Ig-like domain-containing protein n=1 Tax=Cyprinodon variegatus TaxID=28743 RepID=A0A3Q2D218_CYPVA
MFEFLLRAIVCLCFLQGGVCSACDRKLIGERGTFFVPAGSSLSLSCVVQHCGNSWDSSWTWLNATGATSTVEKSARHFFTDVPLNTNKTKVSLKIASVIQADEGSYACKVKWRDDEDTGHWMQVNVTKGVESQRKAWHRVMVCAGAFLCLPVILGLARCLSSEVKPQAHPRKKVLYEAVNKDRSHQPPQPLPRRPVPKKRNTPPQKAPSGSQQKSELLYADISQDALRIQKAGREPLQPTIYSSVRFSH